RGYATATTDSAPKVATFKSAKPTASVTVLLSAGSRHEAKPGVAHVLSNFAFKRNAKHSALGTVRQAELYGGVLSSTLTREHLALTAEFLPGDEAFFIDLLASHISTAQYTPYELQELVYPSVLDEARAVQLSPATRALELAHAVAFRRGLGNSLFADPDAVHAVGIPDIATLHTTGLGGASLSATNLDAAAVAELFAASLPEDAPSLSSTAPVVPVTTYFGGSTRIADFHAGSSAVFLGFGTTTAAAVPALHALAAHISPAPAVKWSAGAGPLAGKLPGGIHAETYVFPYSDGTLFGTLLRGSPAVLKDGAQAVVTALKDAAGGLGKEAAQRAAAKAKFTLLGALESPLEQAQLGERATAQVETVGALDGAAISKVAAELLKSKATFTAVGDVHSLPYADEVGL
ncbi:Metalloenzyme, LuxS/M16 peptidase-like protein, partial [Vararia minispora EC-137]